MTKSKCGNASYCKFSSDKIHCDGTDEIIEECLYLKSIGEIAKLNVMLVMGEKDNDKL